MFVFLKKNKALLLIFSVLAAYLIFGFYLRYETLDIKRFNEWLTRDFDRALNLAEGIYIPLAGPETSGGGRLPGPFLYFLMAIPLFFELSYESIFIFHFLLNVVSVWMFFHIANKYFGLRTGVLATILLSIDLVHIDTVAFPINPAFIFPLIILFLGLLLELTNKRNPVIFPLLLFLICLAIQIHYSVATYFLVLIAVIIFFRIKVPLRHLFTATLYALLALSPYLVYKETTFEPEVITHEKFFEYKDNPIKTLTLQKTLRRLAYQSGTEPMFGSSPLHSKVRFVSLCFGFYGLIAFIGINSIQKNLRPCINEKTLLLLFYIPALIYEILSPTTDMQHCILQR